MSSHIRSPLSPGQVRAALAAATAALRFLPPFIQAPRNSLFQRAWRLYPQPSPLLRRTYAAAVRQGASLAPAPEPAPPSRLQPCFPPAVTVHGSHYNARLPLYRAAPGPRHFQDAPATFAPSLPVTECDSRALSDNTHPAAAQFASALSDACVKLLEQQFLSIVTPNSPLPRTTKPTSPSPRTPPAPPLTAPSPALPSPAQPVDVDILDTVRHEVRQQIDNTINCRLAKIAGVCDGLVQRLDGVQRKVAGWEKHAAELQDDLRQLRSTTADMHAGCVTALERMAHTEARMTECAQRATNAGTRAADTADRSAALGERILAQMEALAARVTAVECRYDDVLAAMQDALRPRDAAIEQCSATLELWLAGQATGGNSGAPNSKGKGGKGKR